MPFQRFNALTFPKENLMIKAIDEAHDDEEAQAALQAFLNAPE